MAWSSLAWSSLVLEVKDAKDEDVLWKDEDRSAFGQQTAWKQKVCWHQTIRQDVRACWGLAYVMEHEPQGAVYSACLCLVSVCLVSVCLACVCLACVLREDEPPGVVCLAYDLANQTKTVAVSMVVGLFVAVDWMRKKVSESKAADLFVAVDRTKMVCVSMVAGLFVAPDWTKTKVFVSMVVDSFEVVD